MVRSSSRHRGRKFSSVETLARCWRPSGKSAGSPTKTEPLAVRMQRGCLHSHVEPNPLRRAPAGGHSPQRGVAPGEKQETARPATTSVPDEAQPVFPSGVGERNTSRDGPPPACITSTTHPKQRQGHLRAVRRYGKGHDLQSVGKRHVFQFCRLASVRCRNASPSVHPPRSARRRSSCRPRERSYELTSRGSRARSSVLPVSMANR